MNKVTTATPIISAVAAAAVRRGWPAAFRPASVPATPREAVSGRAASLITGPAAAGPRATAPTATARPPSATIPGPRLPGPASPASTAATPAASSTSPAAVRRRGIRPGSAADSRSASSGATRAARTAGTRLTVIVTAIPVSTDTARVPPVTASPPAGSAKPARSNRPLSSSARPRPAAVPRADPAAPTASASASTPRSTWPRVAPRARSRADSAVRCATRMPNVLAIENAATSSAIPAKMTRMTLRAERNSAFRSLRFAAVSWAPLSASTPRGSTRSSRATRTGGLTPRAALTWMDDTRPPAPPAGEAPGRDAPRARYRCAAG